jgi:hypothetical protein
MKEIVAASVSKTEISALEIRCADHAALLYLLKLAITSQTSGCSSVGIVLSRTKATKLLLLILLFAQTLEKG